MVYGIEHGGMMPWYSSIVWQRGIVTSRYVAWTGNRSDLICCEPSALFLPFLFIRTEEARSLVLEFSTKHPELFIALQRSLASTNGLFGMGFSFFHDPIRAVCGSYAAQRASNKQPCDLCVCVCVCVCVCALVGVRV